VSTPAVIFDDQAGHPPDAVEGVATPLLGAEVFEVLDDGFDVLFFGADVFFGGLVAFFAASFFPFSICIAAYDIEDAKDAIMRMATEANASAMEAPPVVCHENNSVSIA
jgi:hypothetical protein